MGESLAPHAFTGIRPFLEKAAPAVTEPQGIGASLAALRNRLVGCGQSLADLVEPAGQALVSEAISRLGQQVFRIVVVGQIKSGKSSFINAFVRQPTLLPTDVTPWTTTVTNLHFGQPAAGNHAAAFQFFSEEEWRDLAEGGGGVRELTQRLVPGFAPELLRQHVEALKRRAGARLGSEFDQLLGKTHYFDTVTTDLLLSYVCSGNFAANGEQTQLGKYADMTRKADLYFDDGPFIFPVTVTDTPGTNDPFLIRDEITRRSLDSADLYVVVLTARQPLSESDVTLMRLMHGLNPERVIVFVNRIDDFSDVGYDLAEVLVYVERKLQAEFPGAQIPIVAGSASWANSALKADAQSLIRLIERPSLDYLAEIGLVRPQDLEPDGLGDPAIRERLCRALLAASGLPAMYSYIADLVGSSQAARTQLRIARCFGEMAHASASSARYELQNLQDPRNSGSGPHEPRPNEVEAIERSARLLNDVATNVEQSAKNIEKQLTSIIGEEMVALHQALQSAVNLHAAKERQVLIETLERGRAPRVWTHEGVELRRSLATTFMDGFQRAAKRVLEFQGRVAPELRQLMSLIAPEIPLPTEPEKSALEIQSPSVAALSRFVALDLDSSWWSSFWKGRSSPTTYGDQVEALIKGEFQPVADELIGTAERTLSGYAATTTKWSFGLCLNIVQGIQRRREQLIQRGGAKKNGAGASNDAAHERKEQARVLTERLERCGAMSRQLDLIIRELGAGIRQQPGLRA
jgi:signal recognition particle receptor subunit beta